MKKIAIMLLAAACVAGGCSESSVEQTEVRDYIDLSAKTIDAGPEGKQSEITVESSGEWRLSGVCDWAHPSAESGRSGETIAFTVDPNQTSEDREATFKFFTGSAVVVLKVTSALGYDMELVSAPEIILDRMESTFLVKVKTNVETLATAFSGNGAEWVEFVSEVEAFGARLLKFKITQNDDYDDRSTVLTISGESVSAQVDIIQRQQNGLEMEPTKLEYDMAERVIEIPVTANVAYSVTIEGDWITQMPLTRGMETKTLRFRLDAAEVTRGGSITISGGGITRSVIVVQKDPNAVTVAIPDDQFRQWLISEEWVIDLGGGACVVTQAGVTATALVYKSADYWDPAIKSIQGIEAFVNLETIDVNGQNLTTVDISELKKVSVLKIDDNALGMINLGDNPIEELHFRALNHYENESYSNVYTENLVVISSRLKSLAMPLEDNWWTTDRLATVDVSECPVLETLDCKRISGALQTIFLKQGQTLSSLTYTEGAQVVYK